MFFRNTIKSCIILAGTNCLISSSALAYELGAYGTLSADFRYRYEFVDQKGLDKNAQANTARIRLGYLTPEWEGLSGFIEGEAIKHIGDTGFRDGVNRKTNYPQIGDPEDTDINQLFAAYNLEEMIKAQIGRQIITYDNQRFIGWSRFRQNDTTYDAAHIHLSPIEAVQLSYAHVWNINRTLGHQSPLGAFEGHSNLLHASYSFSSDLHAAAYTYLLDFHEGVDLPFSSRTEGVRVEWLPQGEGWQPVVTGEIAQQWDHGDNPNNYSEPYRWLELGGQSKGLRFSGIYEMLGGNGRNAMQTPIATLHGFNGWADKFTAIPREGLQDFYLNLVAPLPDPLPDQHLDFLAQAHYYESDAGDIHYGDEGGLGVIYKPLANHSVTAKVSHYHADERFTDTTKFWLFYDIRI